MVERRLPALEPRSFSFNSPFGACPACGGLGTHLDVDPGRVVPDPDKSVDDGAIEPWHRVQGGWYYGHLATVARHFKIRLDIPWRRLTAEQKKLFLYGAGKQEFKYRFDSEKSRFEHHGKFEGVIGNLMRRYRDTDSDKVREWIRGYMTDQACPECGGLRLKRRDGCRRLLLNLLEFNRLAQVRLMLEPPGGEQ